MGIFSAVANFVGGLFNSLSGGGRRPTKTEKVKLAEVQHAARMAETAQQNELQLRLIDKDEERIRLMRDAQAELIKMQTMSRLAIERARVEGMTEIKMLDVAQKRIAIIEAGALPIVREIETFYAEVGDKITAASNEYTTKKLPQLLKLLGQYERGSTEHEIFTAQIKNRRHCRKLTSKHCPPPINDFYCKGDKISWY